MGPNVRANVNAGYADYLPAHLFETQFMYRSCALPCDVAMVKVSLPDENGMVSLGTSVDCSIAAIEVARLKLLHSSLAHKRCMTIWTIIQMS